MPVGTGLTQGRRFTEKLSQGPSPAEAGAPAPLPGWRALRLTWPAGSLVRTGTWLEPVGKDRTDAEDGSLGMVRARRLPQGL